MFWLSYVQYILRDPSVTWHPFYLPTNCSQTVFRINYMLYYRTYYWLYDHMEKLMSPIRHTYLKWNNLFIFDCESLHSEFQLLFGETPQRCLSNESEICCTWNWTIRFCFAAGQMFGTVRGVSLGLGKINLRALDSKSQNRDSYVKRKRKRRKVPRKSLIKRLYIEVKLLKYFLLLILNFYPISHFIDKIVLKQCHRQLIPFAIFPA